MGLEFGMGILYGWIFVAIFGLINIALMIMYPKHYTRRLFTLPEFTSKSEKVLSMIYAAMLNLTMPLSCFLPMVAGITFAIGLILYIVSLICICLALYVYATTEPDTPATEGIYKISRHPQQVFTCTMIMGIGLMLSAPIIIISGVLQLCLLYPSMVAQERFCIEKYGDAYRKYIHETPQYFMVKAPKAKYGLPSTEHQSKNVVGKSKKL